MATQLRSSLRARPAPPAHPAHPAPPAHPGIMWQLVRPLLAAALIAAAATPAFAQRRARLSADLAEHLSAGSQSIDVIVSGDPAAVQALATRYNVPLKRRMKS